VRGALALLILTATAGLLVGAAPRAGGQDEPDPAVADSLLAAAAAAAESLAAADSLPEPPRMPAPGDTLFALLFTEAPSLAEAEQRRTELAAVFDDVAVRVLSAPDRYWYEILVGPFDARDRAEAARRRLGGDDGSGPTVIVRTRAELARGEIAAAGIDTTPLTPSTPASAGR
jgi:hypothetical protein